MSETTTRPVHQCDAIAQEYIRQMGWRINADGLLELTVEQAYKAPYMGRSIRDPALRTLMIPSKHGCTLLYEGKHFVVAGVDARAEAIDCIREIIKNM